MINIIIPAYNAHETIEKTIVSILNQTADGINITVVDDCSDEGYGDLCSRFPTISVIRLCENGGPGVARQAGIDATTDPYIMFVDADDVLTNAFFVENAISKMDDDKSIYVLCASFAEQTVDGGFIIHSNDLVWTFGKVYRRAFMERHGIRFNNTRSNEDAGFNTKLRVSATPFDQIWTFPDVVYLWKYRATSITKINNHEYEYSEGFSGYVANKIEALSIPSADPTFVTTHVLHCLAECYRVYLHALVERPAFLPNVTEHSRLFWNSLARNVYHENVPSSRETLARALNELAYRVIPGMTFDEYLNLLEGESQCTQL